ncbi:hypothetical protein RD792_017331 [Penstemon davidsonii]|uniref:FAD-binding PCMH-type domain-containing protein n=1 Tax=Penstemon davidsonii TaxID=160366 RepID=A0ABR0CLR2_9LAMI|nr:hypothetical protein RD792_017331 [Penstemon davidsonii]
MRNLRTISIDTRGNTAWIQTGATLGEVYYTIAATSRTLAFPAGVCPTVGVGGHFSGGGYGMISRKHGIAVDNIIDAVIINADGEILNRDSMGEDLFWAIRGGGGTSFGIVVAFKVNLVTIPETVTVFNVSRTLEQNATQIVHKWQYISDKIDENLLLRLFIISVRSPAASNGNRTIQASFTSLYLGRVEDLLPIMEQKFPELGLVEQDCIEMSWIESTLFFSYSYTATFVSKSPRAAYFNYRDLDIGRNNIEGNTKYRQASVWGFKYFEINFNRLVRVKTKVDPSNFFRNEQSVPPLSSN